MKYVVIIGDGMADFPLKELKGKTPLQVANIPNLDKLTQEGQTGLMRTTYKDLPIGSIVANMAILGFDPRLYYPNGRASFEAISHNVYLNENDIAFRCNLISIENDIITDFTSGLIEDNKALNILLNIKFKHKGIEIYPGQSYRNILTIKDVICDASDIKAYEPHMNIGKSIHEVCLESKSDKSTKITKLLNEMMFDSIKQIKHLNSIYKTKIGMIWLWSPSSTPHMPSFEKQYKVKGAVVCGLDFMRGIGKSSGMTSQEIKGATGYLDSCLKEKTKYAINFLNNHDFVYIHVNAPDEEAHQHNAINKIKAIERIDEEIIGPIASHFDNQKIPYRIAVLPDHYTLTHNGKHHDKPVPFMVCGKGIEKNSVTQFNEDAINSENQKIILAHSFMDKFLNDYWNNN